MPKEILLQACGVIQDEKDKKECMEVYNKIPDKEAERALDIEREHAATFRMIKDYHAKMGKFPDEKLVFASIGKDHNAEKDLKIPERYYEFLDKMEEAMRKS